MRLCFLKRLKADKRLWSLFAVLWALMPLRVGAAPYGFSIGSTAVTSDNIGDFPGVGFDESTSTLTLTNAQLSGDISWEAESDLTIALVGTSSLEGAISKFSNYAPSLFFVKGDDNDCSLTLQSATGAEAINGFANETYFSETCGLVWIPNQTDMGGTVTSVVPVPNIWADGWDDFGFPSVSVYSDIDGTITYSTDGENFQEYVETFTLTEPCTVYVRLSANGAVSQSALGKFFGFEQSEVLLTYTGEEVTASVPDLTPDTTGLGVSIELDNEMVATLDLNTITATGIGTAIGRCYIYSESDDFTLLNNNDMPLVFTVSVLPEAPAISYDETKTYLNTDRVTIEMPASLVDDENATIWYSWVEDSDDGSEYNEDSKVGLTPGEGTLYAWVRYMTQDGEKILSEKVSQTFSVKLDIALAYVPAFTETAVYTASAITPAFNVYDSEKTMTILDADNYVVSYQKVTSDQADVGIEAENVDRIVDVGTYIVTIMGQGTYGGSKVVTSDFQVTQADFANVLVSAIYDQPYTGSAVTPEVTVTFNGIVVAASEYEITFSNNTDIGEATATLTSTGINFVAGGVSTVTFQIVRRTLNDDDVTFAAGQQYATFFTSTEDLTLPEGIAAYGVTEIGTASVSVQAISYVPKNVPVLLEKTDAVVEASDNVSGNMLRGTTETTSVSSISGGTVYVLYNNEFVKTTSGVIPAHRCYLVVSAAIAESGLAPRLSIGHGGDTTGMDNMKMDYQPMMDSQFYDLQGRLVNAKSVNGTLSRGLYLMNGKKVFIK